MTDAVPAVDPHKVKALELANVHIAPHADVIARANAYHSYLTGKATGKPATAATTQPAAAPAQSTAAATGKPAAAPKPAPAAGAKATPAPGTKPAASTKPAVATPKPAAAKSDTAATPPAAGTNPPPDTKAPGGKHTWKNMCDALTAVKEAQNKDVALAILKKAGGATWARDVKPTLYDAVVGACEQVLHPPKATMAGPVVVTDELGEAVDTSGASAATASEDDPPEGGSGEDL